MIRTVKWAALALVLISGTALVRAGDDKVLSKEEFLAKVMDCNATEKDLAEKAVKNAQSDAGSPRMGPLSEGASSRMSFPPGVIR